MTPTLIEIGFALVLLVGLGLGLRHWFTRPLTSLQAAVIRISQGDFSSPVPVRGRGELAVLGAAIARLQRDLAATAEERERNLAALRESESRYRALVENSPYCIHEIDRDGRLTSMNPSGLRMMGVDDESDIQDMPYVDAVGDRDRDRIAGLLTAALAGQAAEFDFQASNGEQFQSVFVPITDEHGETQRLMGLSIDITARKRAERWQQHYSDILDMISASAPIAEVLAVLAQFAERPADGVFCSIQLLSRDGNHLLHGAAPHLPEYFNRALDGVAIGPAAGACGEAATGKPVISADIGARSDWAPWCELAGRAGLKACWSLPILSSENDALGTFSLYNSQPLAPAAGDLAMMRQSAGLATIALERAKHHEEQRLAKEVFEHSVEGIMVTDAEGRVLMMNPSFESLTGFSASQFVGRPLDIFDSAQPEQTKRAAIRDSLTARGRWKGEVRGRKESGETYAMAMSVATIPDISGATDHVVSIISDISEQQVLAARIEQLAFYDGLTGLPNRALFLDRLQQTLAAAERHDGHGAILFIDLDRFKEINDSLGHAVGDLALMEVARRFRTVSRTEETLARLGGDEFVLVAEGADSEVAALIATRLQRALAAPLELMGQHFTVGASIGIAFYPSDGQTSGDLIKHTDIAMYRAKAGGGSSYQLYQPEMGSDLAKRLNMANLLRQALENGDLQLHYQPQIDLASGRVIGAEALLRWHSGELGWVSPAQFVPIAEERGMMGPLGDWVLGQACRQIHAWESSGVRLDGRLAINVSALQMEDSHSVERMLGIVRDAGLDPDRFELELTESSMMKAPERAVKVMQELSRAGFRLAIDDFGTGYSSLAYLKQFVADQIKIDISFVRNMLTDSNDHTIVTTIIGMARSLGLKTTAEGVEQPGQAEALTSLGCDFAQGYHFGRPVPADVFRETWLVPPSDPG